MDFFLLFHWARTLCSQPECKKRSRSKMYAWHFIAYLKCNFCSTIFGAAFWELALGRQQKTLAHWFSCLSVGQFFPLPLPLPLLHWPEQQPLPFLSFRAKLQQHLSLAIPSWPGPNALSLLQCHSTTFFRLAMTSQLKKIALNDFLFTFRIWRNFHGIF